MKETLSGEIVIIWEGRGQGDSDHGNAPYFTVGWFLNEAEAVAGVIGKGGWGSPGTVRQVEAFKSDDKYFTIREIKITSIDIEKAQKRVRDQALAKLTDEEKRVLGLKYDSK